MKTIIIILFLTSSALLSQISKNSSDRSALYWTHESGVIRSIEPGATTFKEIIPADTPWDVQIDHINEKIYWIAGQNYIKQSGLDGSNVKTIVDLNCEVLPCSTILRKIALDPDSGKLYWCRIHTGNDYMEIIFERSELNGIGTELLFSWDDRSKIYTTYHFFDFKVDPVRDKIYWLTRNGSTYEIDTSYIHISNIDGSEHYAQVLEDTEICGFQIEPDSNTIYYLTVNGELAKLDPYGNTPEIILSGNYTDYGTKLTMDNYSQKLYWTVSWYDYPNEGIILYSINADGTDLTTVNFNPFLDRVAGLAVHEEYAYWSIQYCDIYRSNKDAADIKILVESNNTGYPRGLSYYGEENKLYWYEPFKKRIRRSDENGETIEDVITGFSEENELIDMVIDPNNKKLYWTQYPYGDLYRANLDGSGIEMFAEIEANTGYWWTSPLAIDEVNNKIYYKPSDLAIYAIDLSTKIEEEIYTGNVHQYQIAVNPDKYIFWNQGNSDIYRANLDGSDVTFISSDGGNYPFITVDPANDEVYFTRQQGWGIEEWGILSSDLDFSVELIMENSLNNGSTTEWGIGYIGELALHTNLPTYVNTAQKFPDKFVLCQNYPNPFNPSTTIEYSIPSVGIRNAELGTRNDLRGQEENIVNLKIYDVLGREVATLVNEQQRPGNHEVQFNASGLVNGVYFYRLTSGKFVSTKKLVLLK